MVVWVFKISDDERSVERKYNAEGSQGKGLNLTNHDGKVKR